MEHIDNILKGIGHYYDVLEQVGYYRKRGTLALIVYSFIIEAVLEGPLQQYLEDKDLAVLNKVLDCLSSEHCLISRIVPKERHAAARQGIILDSDRIRDDEALQWPRITQNEGFREPETDV